MASVKVNRDKNEKIISYRLRAYQGRDDAGRQKFVTKTITPPAGFTTPAKQLKEAKRIADEWEKSIRDGEIVVSKQTFKYFVNEIWFPTFVNDSQHKPTTVSFYQHIAPRLVDYFGDKELSKIAGIDVKRFINYLRQDAKQANGKQLSAATVKHHADLLRNILNTAEQFHYIQRNPCRDLKQSERPHREKKKVDFLTLEQSKDFIQALKQDAPIRWQCMMTMLITYGFRRGEILGLQWQDIDFSKKTIKVRRNVTISGSGVSVGTPKTEESIRTLSIADSNIPLLKKWRAEQESESGEKLFPKAFVFGSISDAYSPQYPTEPTRWLRKFMQRHSFPNVSPHDLRHTCGALLLAESKNIKIVQDTLGHADPETTLSFYTGTTEEMLRSAANTLADSLNVDVK